MREALTAEESGGGATGKDEAVVSTLDLLVLEKTEDAVELMVDAEGVRERRGFSLFVDDGISTFRTSRALMDLPENV
ncbi:hypothetical protein [Agrobacterium burrii]